MKKTAHMRKENAKKHMNLSEIGKYTPYKSGKNMKTSARL